MISLRFSVSNIQGDNFTAGHRDLHVNFTQYIWELNQGC